MRFTIRDGLWLTLVIVISLAWAADHAYFMACWELSGRHGDAVVRHPGNPHLSGDLGPYEHWAREMENSDRQEQSQVPQSQSDFVSGEDQTPSPLARVEEVIAPIKLLPSRQR